MFQPNGRIAKTRPREALPRAPICPKFNSDALARCPQPDTEDAYLSFFSGHVVGANGTAAEKGSQGSPLLTTCWWGRPPHLYYISVLPLGDHHFPSLDPNIPRYNHLRQPQKYV